MLEMKKLRNLFKKKVDSLTTAAERFSALVDHINFFGNFVGIKVKDDWRMNNRSIFILVVIAIMTWLIGYTFYTKFPSVSCVELLGGSAFVLSSFAKFSCFTCHPEEFVYLMAFIEKVVHLNATGNRQLILRNTTTTIARHWNYVLGGVLFGLGLYSCWPCYDFFINGNYTLVSPVVAPGVDETTFRGYLILTFVNIFAASLGTCGSYTFSCLFSTYVDVYDGLLSLIENDFNLFDRMCAQKDRNRTSVFRNMMMELMDLARFNASLRILFNGCATVQIISCYYGIVVVLFGYLANNYIGGIGAAAFFITELMMFCFIGQLLQNTNAKILMVAFNSKWYTYEINHQKDILFVLVVFQDLQPISVVNLYPLNFETGLKVVNNIYSALMVALNFLD